MNIHPSDVAGSHAPAPAGISGRFIADACCPVVPVERELGQLPATTRAGWFRPEVQAIADGVQPPESSFGVGWTTYTGQEYALATRLPARVASNADFDAVQVARAFLEQQLLLDRERRVAALIQSTDNWPDSACAAKWSLAVCDVLGELRTLLDTVEGAAARRPTVLVLPGAVWRTLMSDADSAGAAAVRTMIAGNLGVPPEVTLGNFLRTRVLIADAQFTQDLEGVAEDAVTYEAVWTEPHVWAAVVAEGALDQVVPGAACTARFSGPTVERLVLEDGSTVLVRGSLIETALVLNAHCARLLTDVI